jgi:hypothetical protein
VQRIAAAFFDFGGKGNTKKRLAIILTSLKDKSEKE